MIRLLVAWLALLPACAFAAGTLPRAEGSDFRALVWNVSREKFFEHQQDYLLALRAIDADLLIFDEMPGGRGADEVAAVLRNLNAPGDPDWQVAYGSSGDNQRAVIALRGDVEPLRQFQHLPYPPRFAAWMRKLPLNPYQRQRLDQNLDAGIGAFAAQVRIGGRRVIVVGVDLQCCGDSDDAWEERRRYVEARAIRSVLDRVWSARKPDAVIVAGDFNAVRGRRPVNLMQGDEKRPERRLAIADARHANGKDNWTWDGRGTPFPSRAIDFMLLSRSLRVLQALVFDPETMSETARQSLDLDAEMFRPMSEHRPVVVDFAWR
jgi:endonuclease/exonuclease/phosphatase family metal-dependent hydrolase